MSVLVEVALANILGKESEVLNLEGWERSLDLLDGLLGANHSEHVTIAHECIVRQGASPQLADTPSGLLSTRVHGAKPAST